MASVNIAHLPFLRLICEQGSRPAVWTGIGPDPTVPVGVAKRLESSGLIVRKGDDWHPTREGKLAVGRVK